MPFRIRQGCRENKLLRWDIQVYLFEELPREIFHISAKLFDCTAYDLHIHRQAIAFLYEVHMEDPCVIIGRTACQTGKKSKRKPAIGAQLETAEAFEAVNGFHIQFDVVFAEHLSIPPCEDRLQCLCQCPYAEFLTFFCDRMD